jgi:hypothetical protein
MPIERRSLWEAFKEDFPRDKWLGWFLGGVFVGIVLTRLFS